MVTAGVYMVARLGPLYAISETAMMTVAVVGAVTAFMAATIALVQTDIKRVLAYSTVSQLGYMFLACGMGAFGVGIFHLYTHAFFKALLFLGSGSVIHAMSGEQDMQKMGGLRTKIPWTYWTFLVAVLAIAGIPVFSGFFSKDEILLAALGHPVLFGIGLFTALLTAFYMARLLFLTFFGSFRGGHEAEHHVHESPPSMVVPLALLAIGSALGGLGASGWRWTGSLHFTNIPHIVDPVFRGAAAELHHAGWQLPVAATVTALAGIALAWYLYLSVPRVRAGLASALGPALRIFSAKYYWDDVYNGFVRRVVIDGSRVLLWERVDVGVIDGAVNRAGTITGALAEILRPIQSGLVRHYVLLILAGAVALVGWVLWS
jgi:NADH-quinone oxidoreductase subunit L